VARPLTGVELSRPIGIVQRRGKELGKTAFRFMQLLLKQSSSSREIADLDDADSSTGLQGTAAQGGAASDSLTDDLVPSASAKPAEPASRAAS
jgi:hypothetical protein